MDGLLVVDKPAGWTSFDVIAKLRRILKERRLGHTGTLDPAATGVLVVAVGRATRLIEYLSGVHKVYVGVIQLGAVTDTDDAEGTVTRTACVPEMSTGQLEAALQQFVGRIDQTPPAVSAIKVGGRRSYDLAREGKAVDLTPRPVEIYAIDLLTRTDDTVQVRVECGAGTYIRALARDLGDLLGCGGHLRELRRTAVGAFATADAHTMDEIETAASEGEPERFLRPASEALVAMPHLIADSVVSWRIARGLNVDVPECAADRCAVVDQRGGVLAILDRQGSTMHPTKVFITTPEESGV